MPTSAQRLTDRRRPLGLPATLASRLGEDVPVTGDLCAWLEGVAAHADAPWTISNAGAHLTGYRDRLVLTIGPANAPAVTVVFDNRGRWTHTSTVRGRHFGGGSWRRGRTAGELQRAVEFYGDDARREWYRAALALPQPPDWALQQQARVDAQRRSDAARQAANYDESIRRQAESEAWAVLRERHAAEYEALVEERLLMVALERGRPQTHLELLATT